MKNIDTPFSKNSIQSLLCKYQMNFVRFVDISKLHKKQNRNFQSAILIGIALSPEYLKKVS